MPAWSQSIQRWFKQRSKGTKIALGLGLVALFVLALTQGGGPAPDAASGNDTVWLILDVTIKFALVLGVIILAALLTRKYRSKLVQGHLRHMSTLESLRLNGHASLHLVEVDGKRFMIGSTEQSVQLICELPAADKASQKAEESQTIEPGAPEASFAQLLGRLNPSEQGNPPDVL